MKWIKTEERLPEDGILVLIIYYAFRSDKLYPFVGRLFDGEFVDYEGDSYTLSEVPYWMPYPELPKEETANEVD